jgi:hypothetical protein
MDIINSRKYNSIFRKNLKTKISKLTNKDDFIKIYKIINCELDNKLSINRNGIYFNLNLLSDKSIEDISSIITNSDILNDSQINNEQKITYEIYNKEINIENFINNHKLTNKEKCLIKKFRQT